MTDADPQAIVRVAAFDVDGTLTRRDCVVPFLRRVAGTRVLTQRMLRQGGAVTSAAARRDRDALKAASAMAAFRGLPLHHVESEAHEFARSVFDTGMRTEVVEELRLHQANGDTVVLVSASFEVYLRPLATLLGVDDVLAARLEVDSDGLLTGRMLGANCRGPEKVRRLHEWLDQHSGGRSSVHVTAWGDSTGDRELLADAEAAQWVGRGKMPQ
ncbi:MAG TPA: HAD-IB family hydrolase [Ilumatobacteraceae bacterium]|nr:HAD-IB family hydrolase [Ilumatobacteraceae bacterium]